MGTKYIYKRRYDMKKGLLVVFEGLDGAGKTTQINLLKDWFEKNNKIVYNKNGEVCLYKYRPLTALKRINCCAIVLFLFFEQITRRGRCAPRRTTSQLNGAVLCP